MASIAVQSASADSLDADLRNRLNKKFSAGGDDVSVKRKLSSGSTSSGSGDGELEKDPDHEGEIVNTPTR